LDSCSVTFCLIGGRKLSFWHFNLSPKNNGFDTIPLAKRRDYIQAKTYGQREKKDLKKLKKFGRERQRERKKVRKKERVKKVLCDKLSIIFFG
jgi:hypothetical protein